MVEKAVQELEQELIHLDPTGGAISALTLALATATLNKCIRGRGLSVWEIWYRRDMFTTEYVPVNDLSIIDEQHASRSQNHPFSEASKTPKGHPPLTPLITKGDLLYLRRDVDKHRARDHYIVTSTDGPWCDIKKLRNKSYRVKEVPSEILDPPGWSSIDSDGEENLTSPITHTYRPLTEHQVAEFELPQYVPPPPTAPVPLSVPLPKPPPPPLPFIPSPINLPPVPMDTTLSLETEPPAPAPTEPDGTRRSTRAR